ncbi:MAG TPA: hypothetical protein VGP78_03165 [Solirubrobacteraceae bacterium]|nr:hypothetical protein [Solirubrobacteraceae bacterium]
MLRRRLLVPAAVVLTAATAVPLAIAAGGDISTAAGTGVAGYSGDGGAATGALLNTPSGVARSSDGAYLIADTQNSVVRKVEASGEIKTVAGTGTAGYNGDGLAATSARLNAPLSAKPTPDGGMLIADSGNQRIRKVSANGTISTVAGNGSAGFSGDTGTATAAQLRSPSAATPMADGSFLIADTVNNRIRKVSAAGVITTVAGTGSSAFSGDGGPAAAASLKGPSDVDLFDGGYLVADKLNDRIRRVSAAGVITTVAGNGTGAYFGDGGAATAAGLFQPNGVDVASDGTIFIADQHDDRVRAVAPDGTISTVAGTGINGYSGDGDAATAAMLNFPSDVAVLADGSLLIADQKNHRVRSLAGAIPPPPAEATGTGTQTPSRDGTTTPTARHEDGARRATTTDAAPPPAYGRTVVADVTRGTVSVRLPGVEHAVAVADVRAIPSGSVVDTRRGTLTLTSALDTRGHTQRATFSGARFKVVQDKRSAGVVDIHLLEPPAGCSRASARAAAVTSRPPSPRALWSSDNHGRYRTHGRTSVATVRGTRWATTESCGGTRTTVAQGSVVVRDRGARRQVVVRAGHSYLARPRA